jgi:hypothetical protein
MWVVDQLRALTQTWRRVRVLVHQDVDGVPVVDVATGIPVVCMKVTNLSPQREVEITHVWYQGEPPVHLLGSRLPARLRLDETWEECIPGRQGGARPGGGKVRAGPAVQRQDDQLTPQPEPSAGGIRGGATRPVALLPYPASRFFQQAGTSTPVTRVRRDRR